MSRELPILFSGPMVRAILDGRKTQTRRIVTHLGGPVHSSHGDVEWRLLRDKWIAFERGITGEYTEARGGGIKARYSVGDLMWVRETWRVGGWNDDFEFQIDYQADGANGHDFLVCEDDELAGRLAVQSSAEAAKAFGDSEVWAWEPGESPCRWRPSIHMPKWAARIWLRVLDVRVERIQDITEEDAIAEGVASRDEFIALWESIHGAGSWERNDWVWVYAFVRAGRPNGGER